ncbi:hypothetical protein KPATCC21470_1982 [Kitasatospora purpeofusca]
MAPRSRGTVARSGAACRGAGKSWRIAQLRDPFGTIVGIEGP